MEERKGSGDVPEECDPQISALSEICGALARCLTTVDVVKVIAEMMKTICDFQSLVLFTVAGLELVPQLVVSPYAAQFKSVTTCVPESAPGWVIAHMKPLLLPGAGEAALPRVIEEERSFFIAPMIAGSEVIGILYLGTAEPSSYDDGFCQRVSIVASQSAMAIRNAELRESVKEHAITDGLTGLYTHRYFQELIIEACREYESALKPFSLVMIDVDHFKKYNDLLGHPEGDKILKEITALIRSYTRGSDLVCRYGGDEFAVILKECDKENSVRTAERIREAFQYRFHTYPVKITASIGVASYPEDAGNKIELLGAADTVLYRSKSGGRNQVNVAPSRRRGDDPSPPDR